MDLRKAVLWWAIAFIAASFAVRGTGYQAFVTLAMLTPTAYLALKMSGISDLKAALVSSALLAYVIGITVTYGKAATVLQPKYLPATLALLAIYTYSWIRASRKPQ